MLHPVGSNPPAVYWRRRLILISGLVVLLALTVYVLRPEHGSTPAAGAGTPTAAVRPPLTAGPSGGSSAAPRSGTAASTAAGRTPSTAAVTACAPSALSVSALTTAATFKVGSTPTLYLQVMNTGPRACVQNLADSQVELRVYNGESRVWGSHDCQIQPGTNLKTLAVNSAVRIGVQWSGLSSQPQCAGTRQRVGAGSYTLYALLGGVQGKIARFNLS